MMTKEEKTELYLKHKEFINYRVYLFLTQHPTFEYLRDDLEGECAYRFVLICDKYDGESSKFTTFLYEQLGYYMQKYLAKEIKISTGETEMAEEFVHLEQKPDNTEDYWGFEELLSEGQCTPRQKQMLRLYFIEDENEYDIAERLGVSQQAVNQAIHRALARMRKLVRR